MKEGDRNKKLLGTLLSERGLISENQLQSALGEQKKHGARLGYWAVRLGYIPVEKLAQFFNENKHAGRVEEDVEGASGKIPRSLALYYKIAPIKLEGNTLTVGLAEIFHPNLIELLAEITGCRIDALIQPEQEIRSLIDRAYPLPPARGLELSAVDHNAFVLLDSKNTIKALTIAQLKNVKDIGESLRSFIAEAIKEKYREILLKPEAEQTLVYFKKNSLKQSEFKLSPAQQDDITFLIFHLAKMDVLQQKMPQRGQFVIKINDRRIPMVVSATPTFYGMRLLLEMFDEKILKHSYEEILKPFPDVRKDVEDFLMQKKGVLAITGPEDSGRKHFFYSLLSRAKEMFGNIHTLENSIRYPLNGIHQNEIPEEKMERVLEEYLYQSPDLVAISQLRNIRSAEVAFLLASRIPVLMILSSYDAYKAVEWLCSHNLKSPIKAGLLHAVISPRIIPRICADCSIPYDNISNPPAGLSLPAGTQLKMNQGCDRCRLRENLGSETFFESFRINEEAREWILKDHSSVHLRQSAQSAGRSTLYDVVVTDAFTHQHLDMLTVSKLQAVL